MESRCSADMMAITLADMITMQHPAQGRHYELSLFPRAA